MLPNGVLIKMSDATPAGYTSTAKWLHWGMAFLWIASWGIGILAVYGRDQLNSDHGLTVLHKAIASTLLFLIVARVAWRLTHRTPAFPDSMSPLMQRGAFIGHLLLYAVALVALPLSGWYWSSVADKPIMVAGLFQLPSLVAAAPDQYPRLDLPVSAFSQVSVIVATRLELSQSFRGLC